MIESELAQLRGEFFGLKIIVVTTLSHLVAHTADPIAALDEIQRQSTIGIATATPPDIAPEHLAQFRAAAAAIVLQATEVAKVRHD